MSLLLPIYLLGLLGLLLPWLLHRFSHFDPKEQMFPTTRFLEPTKPPTTNKSKLKYWLLLAMRAAFLLVLCFLFAQPWLRTSNDETDAQAIQLLVIDNSFSMRAGERWQQAVSSVNEVLDDLPEKDAVQLFSFSGQLTALTEPLVGKDKITSAIGQIQPGYESADYGELMRYLNKVAGDFKLPVSATFITDAQRSNLPAKKNSLLANKLLNFSVYSVDATTPVNYSLQAEAHTSDSITARVNVQVAASSQINTDRSDSSTSDISANAALKTIKLEMNDRVLASDTVQLLPGDLKTIRFEEISLPSNKDALLKVSFSETDFLSEDDSVETPVRGMSVLNVAMSFIGSEASEQATVFAKTALETGDEVRVEQVSAAAALNTSVRHALIFTDNLNAVPQAVLRFVSEGGNVLLVANDPSSKSVNKLVTNASRITTVDQAHPLGLSDIDWFDAGFYTKPSLTLRSDDRVLLGLDDGSPVLVERDIIAGGRLLLLNDQLDGTNSDFPLQASYVVLMQRVIEYFNSSNALPASLEVGESLYVNANTQVLSPSNETLFEIGQLGRANSIRLTEPGVYTVLGNSSSHSVSAILSQSESNLLGIERAELDAWESRHTVSSGNVSDEINNASSASSTFIDSGNRQGLWKWLLPVVVALLFIEILLANRMLWVRRDGI